MLQVNSFACDQCGEVRNFIEDEYIPIERAVSQVREEVPSLVELLRTRVDIMSNTRSALEALLGKVDKEKVRSCTTPHISILVKITTWHTTTLAWQF